MFAFSISRDIIQQISCIFYHYALEFTLCDLTSQFVHAFLELHCVVRVISRSAVRFENTWPGHSALFENGMQIELNILFIQTG